jgi:hypothetical protein
MSEDHDAHPYLSQYLPFAPALPVRAPAMQRKRPASDLSSFALPNLPRVPLAAKSRAPAGAAGVAGSAAMALLATGTPSHAPPAEDDSTELQQALAENARLRQRLQDSGPGSFLDQDYSQDDDHGAAAAATGQRLGTTVLPQAIHSAYAGPPPSYTFQIAPAGARVRSAPYVAQVAGFGADYHGAHATHATHAQGQPVATLLASLSFAAYSQSHPDDARTLSTVLNVRDNLCVARHNGALALSGQPDLSNPLLAPLLDCVQSLEQCIPAIKEVVNQLSQRMLFAGRDIGPAAMRLRADLALHNSINPENPINGKELQELQDMSRRVDW